MKIEEDLRITRELLAVGNPFPSTALRGAVFDDEGQASLQRILATPVEDPAVLGARMTSRHVPRLQLKRPRKRLVLVAFAAAAIIAVVVPVLSPNGGGTARASAAAFFSRQAQVAARQPSPLGIEPGQYGYAKSQGARLETSTLVTGGQRCDVLIPFNAETWTGVDGSGRSTSINGDPIYLSHEGRQACQAMGPYSGPPTQDEIYGPGDLTFIDLSTLPTDPDQLRTLLEEREVEGGPAGDAETFVIITDLLVLPQAAPELRSALYQVAATLDGVENVGPTTDAIGRPGTGIAYTSSQLGWTVRHEFVFDPNTSAFLGARDTLAAPAGSYPAGTLIGYGVWLETGVVDSTHDRP